MRQFGPADAPALVLLHGWTVTADLNWFTAYQALAEHYHVVAIDHRGHGRGIRSRAPFRLEDCADDAVAAADALGIDTFTPVGYSMGGPIALETFRRHRHRVRGLVLCATFANVAITPRGRNRLRALGLLGRGLTAVPGGIRQAGFEQLLAQQTADRDLGDWVIDEIRSCDPRLLLLAGGEIGRFDARPWLAEIDVPTSVMVMNRDTVVPPRRQYELAGAIPGARRWELDADHDVCVMGHQLFLPSFLDACAHACVEAASGDETFLYSPP
ncbi:MAG: alpha/beta hydrolase [Acidimicrobiia bacterium]|nr:alpha/beta hydrolase [Acidimicrobiia bacterium]MDH5236132.1 alpha/beta hydrolase [Acidimicrobiia bacterium]